MNDDRLDWAEVEILQNRADLARDQRVVIPLDQEAAVAKHTIGEGRWGFVQEEEVDRVAAHLFEAAARP